MPLVLEAAVVLLRRRLAARGVAAGPDRATLAVEALQTLERPSREDVYWTLRCTMVSRPEEVVAFDEVFSDLWVPSESTSGPGPGPDALQGADPGGDGAATEGDPLARSWSAEAFRDLIGDRDVSGRAERTGLVASRHERLWSKDFSSFDAADLLAARLLMPRLVRGLPRRRTHRTQGSKFAGQRIDLRATLRDAMRTEGEPLRPARRRRREDDRRLVFVVDVSGSMKSYATAMLLFCREATRQGAAIETFAFGTRLTRVTPHLRRGGPEQALQRAARALPDWAGGTRIGESVKAFNGTWGRRGAARGAVVVIVSDGWERGDVELLGRELARLRRTSHRLLWVNPLAGDPGYQPLAAGMATALGQLDVLLPGHSMGALAELSHHLRRSS